MHCSKSGTFLIYTLTDTFRTLWLPTLLPYLGFLFLYINGKTKNIKPHFDCYETLDTYQEMPKQWWSQHANYLCSYMNIQIHNRYLTITSYSAIYYKDPFASWAISLKLSENFDITQYLLNYFTLLPVWLECMEHSDLQPFQATDWGIYNHLIALYKNIGIQMSRIYVVTSGSVATSNVTTPTYFSCHK